MANYKLNQTGEQIQNDLNLIDSNTATSGQVLTADGNGGASWQDANGGGSLYAHFISCIGLGDKSSATMSEHGYNIRFQIINNSAQPFTWSTLKNWLVANSFSSNKPFPAHGTTTIATDTKTPSGVAPITGIFIYNNNLKLVAEYYNADSTNGQKPYPSTLPARDPLSVEDIIVML